MSHGSLVFNRLHPARWHRGGLGDLVRAAGQAQRVDGGVDDWRVRGSTGISQRAGSNARGLSTE